MREAEAVLHLRWPPRSAVAARGARAHERVPGGDPAGAGRALAAARGLRLQRGW